jgi:O-antigen/teichoic acid export membrane protein
MWKLLGYTGAYMITVGIISMLVYFVLWLTSWAALCVVIIALIPSVYSAYFMSLFQSLGYFVFLAGITVMMSLVRFGLSLWTIAHPTIAMATLAIVFPWILSAIFAYWYGRRTMREMSSSDAPEDTVWSMPGQSVYAYILITGVIILMQNIDVLIVKSFSTDYDVTLYASVAVIVKFSLVIIWVFEMVSAPVLVDTTRRWEYKRYFTILTLFSILGYIVSLTLLPWAGNIVLHVLKAELMASWMLWASLGVAMVSLGFFSLYIKVYMSWGKSDILYVGILGAILCLGFFFDTLEGFALFFACVLLCLYTVTVHKIWCQIRRQDGVWITSELRVN